MPPTSFASVVSAYEAEAALVSEVYAPFSDLVFSTETAGTLSGRPVVFSDLARKKVLSVVGLRASWLSAATPETRVSTLNGMLSRVHVEYRFRVRASGEVFAVMPGTHATVTAPRLFAAVRRYLGPVAERYQYVRTDSDPECVQVTAVLPGEHSLGGVDPGVRSSTGGRTHRVSIGWHLTLSETGLGPVEVYDAIAREDGAVILGSLGASLYSRQHRPAEDVELAGGFMVAFARASSREVDSSPSPVVLDYETVLRATLSPRVLEGVPVPTGVLVAAVRNAQANAGEGPVTRVDLAWSLAEVAPKTPLYTRYAVELAAGRILAAGNPKP